MSMRMFLMATALTGAVIGFTSGAHAEGDAAIRSNSTVNTDASMSSVDSGNARAEAGDQTATMQGENVSPRTFDIDANSDAQSIITAQEALRNSGYRVAVDGIWGPQTADALQDYRQANNVSAGNRNESGTAESGNGAGMSMGNESSVSNSRANNSLDSAGDSGTGGY